MSSALFRSRLSVDHPIPEVVLRTRRCVMEAAYELQAQRVRKRRHVGIALLAIGMLVFLFAPALWAAANDLTTGEHFFDLPVMVLTFFLVFLSAIFAISLVTLKDRSARDEPR
jgi:cytochrome bd-type quinol oxidase subunit 2